MKNPIVAFGGSRDLSLDWLPTVRRVVSAVHSTGHTMVVGCCVGADEYVLESVIDIGLPSSALKCLTLCDCSGEGGCSLTAISAVERYAQYSSNVVFSAGGDAHIPLKARLVGRTHSVVRSADKAMILFFSDSTSIGTVGAGRMAVKRGLTVVGFGSRRLPSLGAGDWVSSGKPGVWADAKVWCTKSLF